MYKFSKEQEQEICDDYIKGIPIYKLTTKYNIVDHKVIIKIFKRNNIFIRNLSESHRRYSLDINFFENIDSEEKAYVLGFILADGYVFRNSLQITLHKKDIDILESINKVLRSNSPIKIYRKNYVRLEVSSPKLIKDLLKYGMISGKSATLKIPKISKNLMVYLWRGWIDGDGSISKRYLQLSGTKSVCLSFQKWLLDQKINSIVNNHILRYKETGDFIYRTVIREMKYLKSILELLYTDYAIASIRKSLLAKNTLNYINRRLPYVRNGSWFSLTLEEEKSLINDYKNYLSIKEILIKYSISQGVIYGTLRRNNILKHVENKIKLAA